MLIAYLLRVDVRDVTSSFARAHFLVVLYKWTGRAPQCVGKSGTESEFVQPVAVLITDYCTNPHRPTNLFGVYVSISEP